jgi:hypothetical protein
VPAATITEPIYEILIQAFREKTPPSITYASKKAGVAFITARRAYRVGYPKKGWPPIHQVLLEEQQAARSGVTPVVEAEANKRREHAEREADRKFREQEQARQDVVKSRRQEAELVRAQRGNLTALVATTAKALKGLWQQADYLQEMIASGKGPDGKPMNVEQRLDMGVKLARMTKEASSASMEVVKMERLLLGEPTEILGSGGSEKLTEEEALKGIREAAEAARRFEERRGNLKLLEGGKTS